MDKENYGSELESDEELDAIKGKAKDAAKTSAKTVAKAAKKAKSSAIFTKAAVFLPNIIIGLIILVLVFGMYVAIQTIPSAFVNTIQKYVEGTFQGIIDWFGTEEGKFSRDSVKRVHNTATYLRDRGVQLYADGYIFEKVDQKENLKDPEEEDEEAGFDTTEEADEDFEYDGSDLTTEDRYIPEEGIYVDKDGKVKYMKYEDSPLFYYVWMNGYTFMIDDQHGNFPAVVKKFGKIVKDFLTKGDVIFEGDSDYFPGMIFIDITSTSLFRNIKNEIIPPKVEVDLDKDILKIANRGTANNITLAYDLEGWAGRYGIPMNFIYALHSAMGSPDFIMELIKGTAYEEGNYRKTKMNIIGQEYEVERRLKLSNISNIAEKEFMDAEIRMVKKEDYKKIQHNPNIIANSPKVETRVNPEDELYVYFINNPPFIEISPEEVNEHFKTIDISKLEDKDYYNFKEARKELGPEIGGAMELIDSKLGKSLLSRVKGFFTGSTSSKEYVYMLRMRDVTDHWFRDVYFEMPKGTKYLKYDTDYLIKTGELWTKTKQNADENSDEKREMDYEIAEEDWSVYDNPDTDVNEGDIANLENNKEYVIKEELVSEEMFEKVLEEQGEEDSQELRDAIKLLEGSLSVELYTNLGSMKQYQDARRGMTNPRLLQLFRYKWYRYDGTEETANKINKERESSDSGFDSNQDSELKKKLDPKIVLPVVADNLKRSGDIDSEYIYKDVKELMVEMGYNREELREEIRPVMQWIFKKMSAGKSFPSGSEAKSDADHGIRFLSKEAVRNLFYGEAVAQEQAKIDKRRSELEEKKQKAYSEKEQEKKDKLYEEIEKEELQILEDEDKFIERKAKLLSNYGTDEQREKELSDLDEKIKNAEDEEQKKIFTEQKQKLEKEIGRQNINTASENSESNESGEKEKDDVAKDDPVRKKIESRYGKGYTEDDLIVSPVTGKVKYIPEDSCVEITVLSKEDLPNVPEGYKEFYETEYKGSIDGYKIRIYNVEEASAEKGKYKQQIPKNLISKLSTKAEQEKVQKSEDLKKDAPEKSGEYVKEGTVIAKPIMDKEKIKQINEKKKEEKQKEKEKEEAEDSNGDEESEEDKSKVDFTGLNQLAEKNKFGNDEVDVDILSESILDAPYIQMVMIDNEDSIVDRLPEYIQKNKSGGGFEIEIGDDYDTRAYGGDLELEDVKNSLDPEDEESVQIFKEIMSAVYPNPEYAFNKDPEAFLEAQKETGVNAFFAAIVSIIESSGGTNWSAIDPSTNNIFSIKGDGPGGWKAYDSLADAVKGFANLISRDGGLYWGNDKYTVHEIGPTYCPPSDNPGATETWDDRVVEEWTKVLEKAQELGY